MWKSDCFRKKRESPCLGCERRAVGCHSICGEYTEYRKLADADIEERRGFVERKDAYWDKFKKIKGDKMREKIQRRARGKA